MPPMKTTTDDVIRISKGTADYVFSYEEWVCARAMWTKTGQRLGAIVPLFNAERGTLSEAAILQLREILAGVADHVLSRELNSNLAHGGAAGGELFELVKKTWKKPYRHVTDSTDTVRIGAKRVADFGAADGPLVPRLGDLAAFRSAFDKLTGVAASTTPSAEFVVVGKRYLAERC